jgi:hypothetical protein
MVDCGTAGVWDRGIKSIRNVFAWSGVYYVLCGEEYYGTTRIETRVGVQF